jgi:YcaO-like protein with predicted kinase domain
LRQQAVDEWIPSPYGPHRGRSPEATLEVLRPLLSRFGITRIGMLTGLDTVGIPVAAAYRPNSRSIAVHQGKGHTPAAAKVSAVMEAVECWHAEAADLPLRLGRVDEIRRHGAAVAPDRLPLTGMGEAAAARFLWAEADDLVAGTRLWVPYELVSADFTAPCPDGFGLFRQTTNGLGAGNTPLEAMLHGLYEVVERDAVALWHAASPEDQARRCIDPAGIEGPESRWMLGKLAAASVAVRIWDVTTDIGLPAFVVLTCDADGVAGVEPESGSACHASADVALSRALAEAAQSRVTRISGARDDYAPESFSIAARAARDDAARRLLRTRPASRFHRRDRAATPEADLADALSALSRCRISQVACIDLSRAEIGIPVVRIIIPGLEGPGLEGPGLGRPSPADGQPPGARVRVGG